MSAPNTSSSARLWWAAPSALAVVGALAFAVGFAPRLAQHVRLPTAVTIRTPATGAGDPVPVLPPRRRASPGGIPGPHPSRTPGVTPAPGSTHGTVVQPVRPVVTSPPTEDDGARPGPAATPGGSDSGSSSGDG